MIKLSIIIPYYKTLSYTKELMDILIPQLTKEVEVILIDDGCYEKELDRFTEISKMVKVIHQENKGVSNARNKGLNIAKGKYISFIDSDDKISTNYVSSILNKIDTEDFDYCLFSWKGIGRIKGDFIIKDGPPKWNTSVWNCVYKADNIKNIRFDETLQIGEDKKFNKEARKGKRSNIENILYYYYTEREDNLTGRYMKKEITDKVSDVIKSQLIIYQKAVSKIGGVETWLYEFFKEFSNYYEILFIYKVADYKQLNKYKELVKCIQFNGQKFECDKYICASNQDNIADNIDSINNFYGLIIQADYKAMNWTYRKHPKTNVHIAVSEVAKNGVDLKDVKVIYNLLKLEESKRVLNLISCTRLSKEKGYEKMKLFAKKIKQNNIPFIWTVFVDNIPAEKVDGLCFRQAVLNDISYIANADYYITCSDTESWGYSTAKAFELGTPVIATEYPVLHEQGLIENENGYIVKQDFSNIDEVINKMYNNNLKGFKYIKKDNPDQWKEVLNMAKKKADYKKEEVKGYPVRSLKNIAFVVEGVNATVGTEFIVQNRDRLNYLIDNNAVEYLGDD